MSMFNINRLEMLLAAVALQAGVVVAVVILFNFIISL